MLTKNIMMADPTKMKGLKMKKIAIFVLVIMAGTLFAQTEEQLQAYNDYMTPGPPHQILGQMAGEWNYEMKLYMEPGKEPLPATGNAYGVSIYDGRYLNLTHDGISFGMPFQATQIFGFDRVKDDYISFWIDNMGTGFLIASGKLDTATQTIEMKGTFSEPMTKTDVGFRCVQKLVDNNHFIMQLFVTFGGAEHITWETAYTRK
mgnify:FL=1